MFPADIIFVLLKGLSSHKKKQQQQHYNINENMEKAHTPAQKDSREKLLALTALSSSAQLLHK